MSTNTPASPSDTSSYGQKPRLRQRFSSRVCDHCIRRKVKCDLKRPSCSRCLEAGHSCTYSSTRRKPGPTKGSRASRSVGPERALIDLPTDVSARDKQNANLSGSSPFPLANGFPGGIFQSPGEFFHLQSPMSELLGPDLTQMDRDIYRLASGDTQLTAEQEKELLCSFFRHIQPSIRLFEEEKFFRQYNSGMISRSLLLTLLFLTAKILGIYEFWSGSHVVEDCLKKLLDTDSIEQQRLDRPMALDDFRQSVLLTYYTFHEFPGESAWMKVGMLTRKALQYGLHQIDNHESLSILKAHSTDLNEIEDWRYVWWYVYCLDSYSNITFATPFVIEAESIKTALITTPTCAAGSTRPDLSENLIFLPVDNDLLWKMVKDLSRDISTFNFNMHIVSTKILKEAATIRRLRFQNTSESLQARALLLEDHICAVRLALPAKYLHECRNVSQRESKFDHHSRLICLLHIHAALLILCVSVGPSESEREWLCSWQKSLQYCEDIVSTAKQWDAQFCSSVDPAICFIIYAALVILHLHRVSELTESDLHSRLETYKHMLVLFLQQFGSSWKLPQTLISSFESLSHRFPGPETLNQVRGILNHLQGPRDSEWLRFLSCPSNSDDTRTIRDNFQSAFPEVLPLYDWTTATNFWG